VSRTAQSAACYKLLHLLLQVSRGARLVVTGALGETFPRCFSLDTRNIMRETIPMKKFSKVFTALALTATSATSVAISAPAEARHHYRHHYYGRTYYHGRYCRYSSGTTGLVAGGVAGAVVGHGLIGHGLLGTAAGAVGGAVAGRAIDRASTAPRRCYYR
jgi:hypothetical protein